MPTATTCVTRSLVTATLAVGLLAGGTASAGAASGGDRTVPATEVARPALACKTVLATVVVESVKRTASEAMNHNTAVTRRVLETLEANGVAPRDAGTLRLSLTPVLEPDGSGGSVVTGYRVRRTLAVTIRAGDRATAILDKAVAAAGGAARVTSVSCAPSDPAGRQPSRVNTSA
ncbi:SIMPL domain-containing protein [Streptomyces flavidovirens]|uniref:SIMPL domain-containing protein n=1 Tax=Streptomyces flavidovirens TaxID=67298 RepID=UPI0012FEFC8F|nr:SIMPL domain-containing protein [Streptomyces flavidovirens]